MYYSELNPADCNNFGLKSTFLKFVQHMPWNCWRMQKSYIIIEIPSNFSTIPTVNNIIDIIASLSDQCWWESFKVVRYRLDVESINSSPSSFLPTLLSTARYRIFPFALSRPFSPFSRPWNLISVIRRGINLNFNVITFIHFARINCTVSFKHVRS